MIGLYESILDDELDILNRNDEEGKLIVWKDWLLKGTFELNMAHASLEKLDDGFAIQLSDKAPRIGVYEWKFDSLADYVKFCTDCKAIIFNPNMASGLRLRFGFGGDIDVSEFPEVKNFDHNSNVSIVVQADCTLHGLHSSRYVDLASFNQLSITGLPHGIKVSLKDFDWESQKVQFTGIHLIDTPKITVGSWTTITCSSVIVDPKVDWQIREKVLKNIITIDGNTDNSESLTAKKDGVIQLKGRGYSVHYPLPQTGTLKEMGVKSIIGSTSVAKGQHTDIRYLKPEDIDLVDKCEQVLVITHDGNVKFDTYKNKPDIFRYRIENAAGTVLKNLNFKAWCNPEKSRVTMDNPSNWLLVSCLYIPQAINKGALDNVRSNCELVRLEPSCTLVGYLETAIRKGISAYTGKPYSMREVMDNNIDVLIPQKDLEQDFPFKNFKELKYIVWGVGRSTKGIFKTSKGWDILFKIH